MLLFIMTLAACTGGPNNDNNNTETEVDNATLDDFTVLPEGIYLEGTDSVTMDFAVWIGQNPTTCRVNIEMETADGVIEGQFFTDVQTTYEVPKGAKVRWSAGETEDQYLTAHNLPTHVEDYYDDEGNYLYSIELFSSWSEATVQSDLLVDVPLTAYIDGAYKCFIVEGYRWDDGEWELKHEMLELDDYVEHFTDADGSLITNEGHIFGTMTGTVKVEGDTFVLIEDKYDSLTETWITDEGIGGTLEATDWSRNIIECHVK